MSEDLIIYLKYNTKIFVSYTISKETMNNIIRNSDGVGVPLFNEEAM
jgi:hypothetical protein